MQSSLGHGGEFFQHAFAKQRVEVEGLLNIREKIMKV
jgi:hypothetical protein